MTSTLVRDSIVGDAWIQQAMLQCPPQRIINQTTGTFTGDILTGPVRLAFENIWELPKKKEGDTKDGKYGASLLFPPNVDFTIFYEEYYKMCGQAFPEYYVNGQYHGLHSPFHDQAEKAMKYNGFTPGCVYFNTTTKFKPSVVDARMNPIVDHSKLYAGVWAICAVNTYDYGKNPPQPKKGVGFGLQSVMIIGDDTKFAGQGPDVKQHYAGVNITAPIARPDFSRGMPTNAPAPAAGIPGYTAPGGGVTPPHGAPPAIHQTHYVPGNPTMPPQGYVNPAVATPPQGAYGAATASPSDDDDMSFLN